MPSINLRSNEHPLFKLFIVFQNNKLSEKLVLLLDIHARFCQKRAKNEQKRIHNNFKRCENFPLPGIQMKT